MYAIRDAHGKAGAYAIREFLCCQEMRAAKGCTGCVCSRGTRGARMAAPQRVRGDSAGTGFAQPAGLRGSAQKRKGPPGRSAQGAASHGRPVLNGRNGESAAARRSGTHKNEEAPCRLGRGPRESSGDLLSRARGPGTIGDLRLNFRVRDGNGCDPHSITAETNSLTWNQTFCNRQNAEAGRVRAAHAADEPNR